MHHALQIQEILANIFDHCSPWIPGDERMGFLALAALARTCRAFKEPALDVLWRDLVNLSSLARCLPEATRRSAYIPTYSFTRRLTRAEWSILRSYTRRIRSIRWFNVGLDWKSVASFLNPPPTEPLFPNVHTLHCDWPKAAMPLLRLPFPALVHLELVFLDQHSFQYSLESFAKFSPNIRWFFITMDILGRTRWFKIEPNHVSCWRNLCHMVCPPVVLDADALVHLSHASALTKLTFTLSATLPASDASLCFSALRELSLSCRSLRPISLLLCQIQLPSIENFEATIASRPSSKELTSFLTRLPRCASHAIRRVKLDQSHDDSVIYSQDLPLGFEDLRPCTAFSDLRNLELNVKCNVGLTDNQVLTLASAWPKLEQLLINDCWGWNSGGGITLDGLVRLLRTCRSLRQLAVCLDTRGCMEVPPSQTRENLGLTLPPDFMINVLDSVIEAESVPTIAAFFRGLAACTGSQVCSLLDWNYMEDPDSEMYAKRWADVFDRASKVDESVHREILV